MVVKNAGVAAKERKAKNLRCRELMRAIKSGKASDAEFQEFAAMPNDIGPSRGKVITEALLGRKV